MRVRLAKKRAKQGDEKAKEWLKRRRWRLARPAIRAVTSAFFKERLAQQPVFRSLVSPT